MSEKWKPTVIQDTRDKTPWIFDCDTIIDTLDTGDYSLMGFNDYIRIERKSLPDFIGCLGAGRDRFKRELQRLRSYKCKAVIIECNVDDIDKGKWRQYELYKKKCKEAENKGLDKPACKCITPAHAWGAIASWRTRYDIEFVFAGSHETASKIALLYMTAWVKFAKDFAKRFENM